MISASYDLGLTPLYRVVRHLDVGHLDLEGASGPPESPARCTVIGSPHVVSGPEPLLILPGPPRRDGETSFHRAAEIGELKIYARPAG
jgi:hypothetical protein